jgi:hypothetical protein
MTTEARSAWRPQTGARACQVAWCSPVRENAVGAAALADTVAEMPEQVGEAKRSRDILARAAASTHR